MRRIWEWLRAAFFVVALVLVALPAAAQRTGGSFGGGDWGSSPSPSSSSSSGRSSSSSTRRSSTSSRRSSSTSSSRRRSWSSTRDRGRPRPGRGSPPTELERALGDTLFVLLGIALAIMAIAWLVRAVRRWLSPPPEPDPRPFWGWDWVDLTAIQLAIDWRARPFVQGTLSDLALSGRTGTQEGLAELLAATARTLVEVRLAWLYAAVRNHHPLKKSLAEGTFRQLGVDARARFTEELVRAEDGAVSEREASPMRARPEEGEGVVVVTLLVAAKRELLDVLEQTDAAALARLLGQVERLGANELVAMEVIWSPAAEDDRMSTYELEVHYPELEKIDEGSLAGRTFCQSCRGPYPAELGACPHCGAPHPSKERF